MRFRSHRGGVYYTPENTMPAFRAAIDEGFDNIETDPILTKDGVVILFHDGVLHRALRNPDGSKIEKEIFVKDLTYDEIMKYDAGLAKGEDFRGTKVATLEELLAFAEGKDVRICLDKFIKQHDGEELDAFFALLRRYNTKVSFLVETMEQIEKVLSREPDARIDWDGPATDEALTAVTERVKNENLVVWLYLDKPNFSWLAANRKTSKENCERVKRYARLGLGNVNNAYDVKEALEFEPYIIEV